MVEVSRLFIGIAHEDSTMFAQSRPNRDYCENGADNIVIRRLR